MNGFVKTVAISLLSSVAFCAESAPRETTLVGRILLPPGEGSRGVELVVTLSGPGSAVGERWLLFDEDGGFSHTLDGELDAVRVSTGIRHELHRIDAPPADARGRIDVGTIDLRDRLMRHRMTLRAADGAAPGKVRVAMCFGPPPVGPGGERVSLGSRQFPPIDLGGEVEWLLPHDAREVNFLVERPLGSGDEGPWQSGHQRLFGPFTSATLPGELLMD